LAGCSRFDTDDAGRNEHLTDVGELIAHDIGEVSVAGTGNQAARKLDVEPVVELKARVCTGGLNSESVHAGDESAGIARPAATLDVWSSFNFTAAHTTVPGAVDDRGTHLRRGATEG
jgi:hypothetical protein